MQNFPTGTRKTHSFVANQLSSVKLFGLKLRLYKDKTNKINEGKARIFKQFLLPGFQPSPVPLFSLVGPKSKLQQVQIGTLRKS